MDKQQAQQIIQETFENSFDKSRFTGFVRNLLNHIEFICRYLFYFLSIQTGALKNVLF